MRAFIRRLVYGTVRRISFVASAPYLIGCWLAGGLPVYWPSAAVAISSLSGACMSFNNLADVSIDERDPRKPTATLIHQPAMVALVTAGVLMLLASAGSRLPFEQQQWLMVLTLAGFWYGNLLSFVLVFKRWVVASVIAATSIMDIRTTANWLWFATLLLIFYQREKAKDRQDAQADQLRPVILTALMADWRRWSEPLIGAALYLVVAISLRALTSFDCWLAIGIASLIWAYGQTRERYGWIRQVLPLAHLIGIVGLIFVFVALTPLARFQLPFLLVSFNVTGMLVRGLLPARPLTPLAIAHDCWLWASTPLLAALLPSTAPSLLPVLIASITAVMVTGWVLGRRRLAPPHY